MIIKLQTLITLSLLIVVTIACGGRSTAMAAAVTVPNSSFESPARTDGSFTLGSGTVTSWIGFPLVGIDMGVENPLSSRYEETADMISDPAADGSQYAYINTFAPGETGSLTSAIVATITPDTRYALTVSLGHGLDIGVSLYTIELLANNVSVSSQSLDGNTITPGTFTTLTTTFLSPASGPLIDESLRIRLTQSNVTGIFQGIQGHYDNVMLDASPVPEPSGIALAAIGFTAVSIRGRRWRRARGGCCERAFIR